MLALLSASSGLLAGQPRLSQPRVTTRHSSVVAASDNFYDFSARALVTGTDVPLSDFKGKVSLVVNVASAWGLTDTNYRELQALYQRLSPRGFEVLAFPCNQFGGQESGTEEEIRAFADGYGVTFPMFAKVDVNGFNQHPVWKHLKNEQGELFGSDVKWNFGKFLVDPAGKVVKRYGPQQGPASIEDDIVAILPAAGAVKPTSGASVPADASL